MPRTWPRVSTATTTALALILTFARGPGLARAAAEPGPRVESIVAATEDGAYEAVYAELDGELDKTSCGMRRGGTQELLARAVCDKPDDGDEDVLPFEQWLWRTPTPEVGRLKKLEPGPWKGIRLRYDDDTRLALLEVQNENTWTLAHVFASRDLSVTGMIKGPSRYVFCLLDHDGPDHKPRLWSPTFTEMVDVAAQLASARKQALEYTALVRAQRKQKTTLFSARPDNVPAMEWTRRMLGALAIAVRPWEVASVYRPLTAADTADALWLLAWMETPQRRHQALAWYLGLRDRDARGAARVLDGLAADADTRPLADHLRTARDYLRELPDLNARLTPAAARALSEEQLLWMRRAYQARAGFPFDDDPAALAYFSALPWYQRMSGDDLRKMQRDPAWQQNPDLYLVHRLARRNPVAAENLRVVVGTIMGAAKRREAANE